MNRDKLNVLRRCAGVPQDFNVEKEVEPIVEDVIPGMSQILRGGKHKFYLVVEASKDSDLGDVITEVDIRALANIIKGAEGANTKEWELFPHNKQNDALNLARQRLASVTEGLAGGVNFRDPDAVPLPTDDEMSDLRREEEEEDVCSYCNGRPGYDAGCSMCNDDSVSDFEPPTNICPDCEGGEHPPALGKCERCNGEGEIYEAKEEENVEEKIEENVEENVEVEPEEINESDESVYDKPEEGKDDYRLANDTSSVKVPAKILSELKRVIDELKSEAKKTKPRNEDGAAYYEDTVDAFQIVYDFLAEKTVEGLKQAQIYSQRMMNIQRLHMPDSVWQFIVNGGEARSLKSYYKEVKAPVTGKPFSNVGISTLNKNTHTE